jgi:hypothetical protein
MQCAYHPDRDPVGACVACGRLICAECKTLLGGKIYCSPCADKIFINNTAPAAQETIKSAPAAAPVSQAAATVAAPAPVTINVNNPPPPVATSTAINNSGQGGGITIPGEIRGWSWGAFMFSWIWGIFNSTWLSFLAFIVPFWQFVLGAKGKAWAWQNKRWDSIEHFKNTQKTWDLWGKILFFIWLAGMIIWVLILIVTLIIAAISGGNIDFGF